MGRQFVGSFASDPWPARTISSYGAKPVSGGSQEKGGGEDWVEEMNADGTFQYKPPKADYFGVGVFRADGTFQHKADFRSKSAVAETEPMEKRGATEGGSSSSATANWWEVGNDNKWRAGAGGSTWNYGGGSYGSVQNAESTTHAGAAN